MRPFVRSLSFLLAAALCAGAAAQVKTPKFKFIPGPKPGGGEVKYSAVRGEAEKDEYVVLEQDVKIEYQDIVLHADKVTWNRKTSDVVAEGHVIIDQGPSRVTANHAVFNLDTKTGTFFNATATMDPSMYFSGDRIEKVDEDTYRLTNGVFTSCDLDRPAWSFHVASADVRQDDYAHLRNLTFRTKGVPVFWAPRLIWPTKRDRSRGFLIPRILFSSTFGTRLENGYFVPFGDSADATVYADVNTKEYNGVGVNVRYLPSENVKIGEFTGSVVNNPHPELQLGGLATGRRTEWKYQFQHAQENLPGGFRGVVDMQDFSNLDFFRQYDRDPRLHTLSNIYSSGYLTKNRPSYSLNILADRRDIIFQAARQRFEQLPALQLRMYPQRVLGSPFYFSLESSTSHLRTSGINAAGVETQGADYARTDVFPTLSLQLRTPSWFSVKPQISLRDTYYSKTLDPVTGRPDNQETLNRFYGQGQVELVGPSFSKIFAKEIGGFTRFKHVIEPRFRYVYTGNIDPEQQQRIIRFDTVDSPFLPIVRNSVEYSLTQRLIGKEKGETGNAREVLSFSLRQTVALGDEFRPGSGGTLPSSGGSFGNGQKFTPLTASLHVNPYQSITLDANATYGNESHQLDQTSISANLVGTGKNADKYLGLTWVALFRQPGIPTGNSSQFRINTGSWLLKDRIRADVQLNYDAKERTFLEQRYLTGWTGSCYGIALEYRRYLVFGATGPKPISSTGIAITLKNIGTIGTH